MAETPAPQKEDVKKEEVKKDDAPDKALVTGEAVNKPKEEYIRIAGTKGKTSIPLTERYIAKEGYSYSHAVDCFSQKRDIVPTSDADKKPGTLPESAQIFKCEVDEQTKTLDVTLIDQHSGMGTITVNAIGIKAGEPTNDVTQFTYTIKVMQLEALKINECESWDCSLYNAFYLGYEGTNVSQLEGKGNARFQYSAYSQFQPLKSISFHILGDLLQTSEKPQVVPEICKTDDKDDACKIKPTIKAHLGLFVPYLLNTEGGMYEGRVVMGPAFDYNFRKADDDGEFVPSYYGGFRFAYNKVRYFSIGYGKSEGIPGHRVKFSGQLPIYDGKLLVGTSINVAADGDAKKEGLSSGDSINVYIVTRVDFGNIFTKFK